MRTTIKDVAHALDVNVATVSRALNDKPGVSSQLRKKIQNKATEMNYRAHGGARGLVTQRTETIGVLFDLSQQNAVSQPFDGEIFLGIEPVIKDMGYALMLGSVDVDETGEAGIPRFILEDRCDGVLIVGAVNIGISRALQKQNTPTIMVDHALPGGHVETFVTNNVQGARTATEHLVQLGHKHIAFVSGEPIDHGAFGDRFRGYEEALEAAGLPLDKELVESRDGVNGYGSMTLILERVPEVTAVVACNDEHAMGCIRAIHARELDVPRDVSVVGFDDIHAAKDCWPPLTTMRVNRRAMGRVAAQRLLQRLDDETSYTPHQTAFPAELVTRSSSAPPRKTR